MPFPSKNLKEQNFTALSNFYKFLVNLSAEGGTDKRVRTIKKSPISQGDFENILFRNKCRTNDKITTALAIKFFEIKDSLF